MNTVELANHFAINQVEIQSDIPIDSVIENIPMRLTKEILPGTGALEYLNCGPITFFGVHKDAQKELFFPEARKLILEKLCLSPDTKILQIVGDSSKYSEKGTVFGGKYLKKHLENNCLVLWGYTGSESENQMRCDVNELVNRWVDADPSRSKRVLANAVDYHTVRAIRNYHCTISKICQNFYLVYGNARFGDDVISSDSLTDFGICLEGGVQSFRQVVNFLLKGIPIRGAYGLREKGDLFFSAAEFLDRLKYCGPLSLQEINEQFEDYMLHRHLVDPKRQDSSVKQALFQEAWTQFQEEKLWERLSLCQFEKVESPSQ